jgi:hypothetical protein
LVRPLETTAFAKDVALRLLDKWNPKGAAFVAFVRPLETAFTTHIVLRPLETAFAMHVALRPLD